MVKLSRILKDYQESGALNALVNVHAAVDDYTFLTKSGDLLAVVAVQGVDYECLDHSQLDQLARRFEAAARIFDEGFRVYQYLIKRDNVSIPYRHYDNPVIEEAIANRMAYLIEKASRLYSLEIYFAVVYEGSRPTPGWSLSHLSTSPRAALREMLSTERKVTVLEEEMDKACEFLKNKVMNFVIQLQDAVHVEVLDKQRAFRFFRGLLNYTPYKSDGVRLKYNNFVDFFACDSALECHRDHLRLDEYYVEVLSLKEPPAQTFAHLLRGLHKIPSNYIIASEWKRESNSTMRKLTQIVAFVPPVVAFLLLRPDSFADQTLARHAGPPRRLRLQAHDRLGHVDRRRVGGGLRTRDLGDDGGDFGKLLDRRVLLLRDLDRLGQRDRGVGDRHEHEVALVQRGHELFTDPWHERDRPGHDEHRDGEGQHALPECQGEHRAVRPYQRAHDRVRLLATDPTPDEHAAQHQDQRHGQEGGANHRECLRKRERMEELALLAGEREHRDEGQDDDRHREEDRAPHEPRRLEHGLGHAPPVARIDPVPLDESKGVLGDDDGRVDQHADRDGDAGQ